VTNVFQQRTVPDTIRVLSALERIDYVDLFTATAPDAKDRSPEQWARAAMEGASAAGRFIAWQVILGLRLERRPSPDHVAGWKIADRGDGWIRFEASSWFLTARIVCRVEDGHVSVATFLRYDRPVAALVWPALSGFHRRAMPGLLRHAVRRLNAAAELRP
jgi:hypothetical protein